MADWSAKLSEALSGDDAPTVEELIAWLKSQPPASKTHRLLDEFVTTWRASRNGSRPKKLHSESRWLDEEDALAQRTEPSAEAAVEWLLANFTLNSDTLYDAAGKRVLLKVMYDEIKERFDIGEKTAKQCVDAFRELQAERMKAFSAGLIPRSE